MLYVTVFILFLVCFILFCILINVFYNKKHYIIIFLYFRKASKFYYEAFQRRRSKH